MRRHQNARLRSVDGDTRIALVRRRREPPSDAFPSPSKHARALARSAHREGFEAGPGLLALLLLWGLPAGAPELLGQRAQAGQRDVANAGDVDGDALSAGREAGAAGPACAGPACQHLLRCTVHLLSLIVLLLNLVVQVLLVVVVQVVNTLFLLVRGRASAGGTPVLSPCSARVVHSVHMPGRVQAGDDATPHAEGHRVPALSPLLTPHRGLGSPRLHRLAVALRRVGHRFLVQCRKIELCLARIHFRVILLRSSARQIKCGEGLVLGHGAWPPPRVTRLSRQTLLSTDDSLWHSKKGGYS